MPHIIPIRDLKKTSELTRMCDSSDEPVFITKNGYGAMVLMSMGAYERRMLINDVCEKLREGERSIQAGDEMDGFESLDAIKDELGL